MGPASLTAIRAHLSEKGFYHHPASLNGFEDIARELGHEIVRDSVRLHLSARLVHSTEAIPFHTDSILADYVGWSCIEPAARGGEIELLDGRELLSGFSPEERDGLAEIRSGPPHPSHTVAYLRPLLSGCRGQARIFFTPWNIATPRNAGTADLLARFRQRLDACAAERAIGIRLEKGECLFIDNRRVLHGRAALPSESPRHLTRIWLAEGAIDSDLLLPLSKARG